MLIPIQTLERSVRLVEQLGELTDPADFAAIVLPALAELVGCDVITYTEVGTDGRPAMISDFLDPVDVYRLELRADFFGPIPVDHQRPFSRRDPDSIVSAIALNRVSGDFDDIDRTVVSILRRPLLRALTRVRMRQVAATPSMNEELSARERAVMELVVLGRTNASIARTLGISPRTVAKHLEHTYRKLCVTSRAAAAARLYDAQR